MNSMGRSMLGIEQESDVVGRKVSELYAPGAYEQLRNDAIPTSLRAGVWYGETALIDCEGTEIPVSQLLMANRIKQDVDVTVLSTIAWDLREQKQIEQELRHQATHDELTGLPNRNLLMDRLAQALRSAERYRHFVAVLFMDLDDFKRVNDNYGHEKANLLLRQFAERLRSRVRAEDTIARYGGDEFVIVVPELRLPEDVARVRKQVINVLDAPFLVGDERVHLGASIGTAMYPHHGTDAETLLQAADSTMYERKRRSKSGAGFGDAAMLLRRVAAFSQV
jgi:diguanylate cyclase (GGDEF)-like protein